MRSNDHRSSSDDDSYTLTKFQQDPIMTFHVGKQSEASAKIAKIKPRFGHACWINLP